MAGNESRFIAHGFHRLSQWLGRSGRSYDLAGEHLDHFAMDEAALYVIVKGSHVLWVGSTGDLVSDPLSRSRFRLALDCATQVLRLVAPADMADRFSIIWDLEGAEPQLGAQAA